ncbi:hypothetical protein GOFOIKOB_0052 [Methylobacterium tardum]|uniref:Uncharacterized protein n=1 Tax=Methylobacterium tardum TaxID=374432 RepID=A0AA37TH65_9HYPH|nr:hypothetical protein [Methylobacterium tardum]GJE47033.1 hypothetical protein GOFOIKOB_0052 [Methylobacterium tardum]GLS71595.1 hypothetical protein GCM10007890_36080 [Methylobacterium tardum]
MHQTTKARDAKRRPVFFASVFGAQAIWERPERTKATGPRRRGVRQVHNLSAPRLLVAAYRHEEYRRHPFDFKGIVARAYEDLPIRFDEAVRQPSARCFRTGACPAAEPILGPYAPMGRPWNAHGLAAPDADGLSP